MDLLRTMPISEKPTRESLSSLAQQARAGDRGAFNEVVKYYHERLYRYLYSLVRHAEDAADLTQEVFLKVYKNFSRYDPGRPFEPWLFTIARRTAMSHFRGQRNVESLSAKHLQGESEQKAVENRESERMQSIWEIARRLPDKLFQVLYLHYREDFSVADVAQIMGVSKIHARVLMHRARKQLKEHYQIKEVS